MTDLERRSAAAHINSGFFRNDDNGPRVALGHAGAGVASELTSYHTDIEVYDSSTGLPRELEPPILQDNTSDWTQEEWLAPGISRMT
ncbi:hypothetical protein HDU93_005097, partial [Gonapodya sp. JEL0774]